MITGYTPSGQRLQSGVYQQTYLHGRCGAVSFDPPVWQDLNRDGLVDTGDALSYSAVLRNTGNYRLTAVSVLTARSGVLQLLLDHHRGRRRLPLPQHRRLPDHQERRPVRLGGEPA